MNLKNLNIAGLAAPPPAPRVVDVHSKDFKRVVLDAAHAADAEISVTDAFLESTPSDAYVPAGATEENIDSESEKLSRLVDDDFPFDESQLVAIGGLVKEKYGCLIGAAGTGKTTTTKKLVDMLRNGLAEVDMSKYWTRGVVDEHDDYEAPEKLIPSIVMVSFTGRASQMTKKNFPRDWHGNIMTIHRALGFYPEFFMAYDEDTGQMRNKRRFTPAYDATNLMPWDIVIIDETGMLGLELWHQLYAACKPTCRIIMIGDINQLPPTHGKSVLGFALASWPTWELTHIHRQQGANNSIVDNAHRVLKGLRPTSDCPDPKASLKTQEGMVAALNYMGKDPDWRFMTLEVPEEHRQASLRIRQMLKLLQGRVYEPNRDVVITPINGFEATNPGSSLGQHPMNQELVIKLNSDADRYFIDAGRERQNFALGDKVMATTNDYEAGVTNGMTGIIVKIEQNGGYRGDLNRFGRIKDVQDHLNGLTDAYADEEVEFSLDEMAADSDLGVEEAKKKDERDAGPASHIVTVRFGEAEHAFEIAFDSKSRVASLMLAYVATCHKMQGGEAPVVFVIVHQSNKRPLNREWFYTAITRASQRCIVLYTRQGIGFALGKQSIKGTTLSQKVRAFQELQRIGIAGATVKVKLPQRSSLVESTETATTNQFDKPVTCSWCGVYHAGGPEFCETGTEITNHEENETPVAEHQASDEQAGGAGLPARVESKGAPARAASPSERLYANLGNEPSKPTRPSIRVGALHIHIHQAESSTSGDTGLRDGGILKAEGTRLEPSETIAPTYSAAATLANIERFQLPAPVVHQGYSTRGWVEAKEKMEAMQEQRLLSAPPKPVPAKASLAFLLNRK